jgi:hypothetical protein
MQYTVEYHFHSPTTSPASEFGPEFVPERGQLFNVQHTMYRLDEDFHNVLHIHLAVVESKLGLAGLL